MLIGSTSLEFVTTWACFPKRLRGASIVRRSKMDCRKRAARVGEATALARTPMRMTLIARQRDKHRPNNLHNISG